MFYPRLLLNLVQLEIAPFDPPTAKTILCNQTGGIADWLAFSGLNAEGFESRWGLRNLVMELVNNLVLSCSFVEIMRLCVVSVCINLSYGIVGITWRSFVLSFIIIIIAFITIVDKPQRSTCTM